MTPPQQVTFSLNHLDPDTARRVKARAEILESNLFTELKTNPDSSQATVAIERRIYQPEVITFATIQFLQRFNIQGTSIQDSLHQTQLQKKLKNGKEILTFDIEDQSHPEIVRVLDITVTPECITLVIKGVPPVPGVNGKIEKFFFDYKKYPGKMLDNGRIDFKELQTFPPVEKNADLLYISYAIHGKSGFTYDGKEIQIHDVQEYAIELQDNVSTMKSNQLDRDDKKYKGLPRGYLVKSDITGVVVLETEKTHIKSIAVRDEIILDRIDYSVGNIGSEIVSPVSINADTICGGFKVVVNGDAKIAHLDGGHVTTHQNADVDQVRQGSHLSALGIIQARTIGGAKVISKNEKIVFGSEVIDSTLQAPIIQCEKAKTMTLNSIFFTDEVIFDTIKISGENKLILGKNHFIRYIRLLKEKKQILREVEKINAAMKMLSETTVQQLTKIAQHAKNDSLISRFKLLIHLLQASSFQDGFDVLNHLREHMNITSIDSVKKSFTNLQKLHEKKSAYSESTETIQEDLSTTEHRINNIRFTITGTIKPGASIKIFCNKDPEKKDPDYVIDSASEGDGNAVNITGHYKLISGLTVSGTH